LTVVLTGGGSGGHITPLMAVAAELKRLKPSIRLVYIGQKGDGLADIPADDPNIDQVFLIRAGKFRRYHGEGLKQLLDLKTMALNVRDGIFVLIGIWQSYRLMAKINPGIVFSRGGFVSVPVALGATLRHIPYITHDSDSVPSLANRLIARWASLHAVALPADLYPYPAAKTVTTGIPLNKNFVPLNAKLQANYREEIEVPQKCKLLFVIGGGLGAQKVNHAVAEAMPHLLQEFKDLYLVHSTGRSNEAEIAAFYRQQLGDNEQGRVKVFGFINDVYRYGGAADLVITRAGATNLAEFAVQGKACIVIPSPFLVGGHQLKNAQYLADQQAAEVIKEDDLAADSNRLAKQVSRLLKDKERRDSLGRRLAGFAKPDATTSIARLIMDRIKDEA
jgi:UDP-N-acetylglucosamine--N-acetylmuramyl-(pentapeptide) pyrophosphoryl-undecaprenol N-acetylglucosamine transferase